MFYLQLPFVFIIYFNDETVYDSRFRPQNGTTMVLTFQSDRRYKIVYNCQVYRHNNYLFYSLILVECIMNKKMRFAYK